MRQGGGFSVGALALLALALALPSCARAVGGVPPSTFTVDTDDGASTSEAGCLDTDTATPCPLRGAVSAANDANLSLDVIVIAVPGPIVLTTDAGPLQVSDPVTIMPSGDDVVTITRGASAPDHRIFEVFGAGETRLERLRITGGRDFSGGGILLNDTSTQLVLDGVTVEANFADDVGGGLAVFAGSATIENSTFTGNSTSQFGAGGAIFYSPFGSDGAVGIRNSTIHANDADYAGGIYVLRGKGRTTPFMSLEHVTLTDNTAGSTSGNSRGTIPLVRNLAAFDADVDIFNSIIGGATTPGIGGPNCEFSSQGDEIDSHGGNVADDQTCDLDQMTDEITGGPLELGPLADNGGPTLTRAITAGSPAYNAGITPPDGEEEQPPPPGAFAGAGPVYVCPSVDQRGVPRPQSVDGAQPPLCDRGAFELAQVPPPPPPPSNVADVAVEKTGPLQVFVGDPITWTVEVTNAGPDTAASVVLSDPLPAGLAFDSATAGCTEAAGTVTCALGSIPAGGSETLEITALTSVAGTVTNVAEVVTSTSESDLTNNDDDHVTEVGEVVRCAGLTRITTAIECSQEVFASAPDVVLTRSDLFPDAQAGTPLAVALGAPLLLSEPAALNADTEAEILRVLEPGGRVHLLGGTEALSEAVEARLAELAIPTVRYDGVNRFATAALIADQGLGNPGYALVADGGDFPDSIIAGAAGVVAGAAFAQAQPDVAPVLLTSGDDVPPETAAYLDAHPTQLIAVGAGASTAFPDVESLVGATRFETAVLVAERFFPSPAAAGLATGANFADALVGGAIVGTPAIGPGPMLLTEPDQLPDVVADYLAAHADTLSNVLLFGGTAAVSQAVEDAVAEILAAR